MIFTKIAKNSSKIFFYDLQYTIFGKVFDDLSLDNTFGYAEYTNSGDCFDEYNYIIIPFF